MATEQKTRTRFLYSYELNGQVHQGASHVDAYRLNEQVLRNIEAQINARIIGLAIAGGARLLKGEPNAFIHALLPIKE